MVSPYPSPCFKFVCYLQIFPGRLINQEGSLLSYAGSGDKDAKVTAAIASSIWAAYEKNGKMAFHNDELKMIFMDCEVCETFWWFEFMTYLCKTYRKYIS